LLFAELYTFLIMVLGYVQLLWGLDRKPYPLPRDSAEWPTVDIFIPTYNEPLDIVKPTVYSAQALDWPREKLRVYVLDDGSRPEFEKFCEEAGCGYIKRIEHNHAKAGNINHAMTKTDGDLIAIFDCDHVPVRSFLQMTVGWLCADEKIAFVQTPHHFYSDDPFIKNLGLDESVASENSLFHNFIQKGNDMWNATMFCGSCAVFRRTALEEVGGIAVETVTEDAHTSLKLTSRGWKSANIPIPLAAGLATESLSSHIGQRMRWARGMVQIFRISCPLFMKGLTWTQKVCYMNGSFYFLHGIPKIVFFLAPLPFLFGGMFVIYASGLALLSYVLPHLVHSGLATQAIQYKSRNPFWSGVYDAVLSCYIVLPTTFALMVPEFGKFNVTQKGGGVVEKDFLDGAISRPYLFLMLLNFLGMLWGLVQIPFVAPSMQTAYLINCLWTSYNLLILGAAVGVAVESRQVRSAPRVRMQVPVYLTRDRMHLIDGVMLDFSQGGIGVKLNSGAHTAGYFKQGDAVTLTVPYDGQNFNFTGSVRRVGKTGSVGILLDKLDMEGERRFYACTFSRSDTWTKRGREEINQSFIANIRMLFRVSMHGFRSLVAFSPAVIRLPVLGLIRLITFIASFLPRGFNLKAAAASTPERSHPNA
jgi:cellulose synthase (UDP-forming)